MVVVFVICVSVFFIFLYFVFVFEDIVNFEFFDKMKYWFIGFYCGGCLVVVIGVEGNINFYFMGIVGGGVWKIENVGLLWKVIFDKIFKVGSIGVIVVVFLDFNVIYVGIGEGFIWGVIISYGKGVYKFIDGGEIWKLVGLDKCG